MKKLTIVTIAAISTLAAAPAFAADGVVNVSGSVAAKCTTTSASPLSINLGELAAANGTLDTSLPNAGGPTALTKSFTIKCTSPAPSISVAATALTTTATAVAGYTNTVHFTASAVADKAAGGTSPTVTFATDVGATGASTAAVGGHLANANDNVRITLSAPKTSTSTDLLFSGGYSGTMTVTIAPN